MSPEANFSPDFINVGNVLDREMTCFVRRLVGDDRAKLEEARDKLYHVGEMDEMRKKAAVTEDPLFTGLLSIVNLITDKYGYLSGVYVHAALINLSIRLNKGVLFEDSPRWPPAE